MHCENIELIKPLKELIRNIMRYHRNQLRVKYKLIQMETGLLPVMDMQCTQNILIKDRA